MKLKCKIREDLYKKNISIPIEKNNKTIYICDKNTYKYKWITDNNFYIKYQNQWYKAYSIDFEFLD